MLLHSERDNFIELSINKAKMGVSVYDLELIYGGKWLNDKVWQ